MQIIDIAKVAHAVNRDYCLAIGDASQPAWDDAPAWQQDSAIDGVQFHLAHPDAGPEASHDHWMAKKLADGWVYGPEKDPARKEHPCLVVFDLLPPEQRAKDYLFRAVVHALHDYLDPASAA